MSRIQTIEPENAPQAVAQLYDAVQQKLGLIPNMVKALGNSPSALQGYLGLSGAVASGSLPTVTREKIALLVATLNDCDYCLRAHTAIGGMLKIPSEDLKAAQKAQSSDPKEQAILTLTQSVIESRGNIPESIQSSVRAAGVSEAEAAEVIANVAVNLFTNYFNRYAQTDCEFPAVEACDCGCASH